MTHLSRGRVLLLTSNFPRWEGDSTTPFVLHLASDLRELGWDIDVLAPHAPGAARKERLGGVTVSRFRYWFTQRGQTVCYEGGALVQLRRRKTNVIKVPALVASEMTSTLHHLRSGYDLINCHWMLPQGFVGGLASRLTGVPTVITVHGGDAFGLTSRPMVAFKKLALRWSEVVTVNSSATLDVVRQLSPEADIRQIAMGAKMPQPDPAEVERIRSLLRADEGPLLVFVGRLVPEKGPDDVIRALGALSEHLPAASAVLVGEGPYKRDLQSLANELGLADRVHFAGWQEHHNVASYLAAADVFVGPSKRSPEGWVEGFGLTFVEASLVGTPVIGTMTGGIGDIVIDGETGVLIPPADHGALAAAVIRLVNDPQEAIRMARAGQKRALERFTRKKSAEAFSGLFQSVLDRSNHPEAGR